MPMGKSRPLMGRLQVQNKMEMSTSEGFGSGNTYMLLDEIFIVHIDRTTIKITRYIHGKGNGVSNSVMSIRLVA